VTVATDDESVAKTLGPLRQSARHPFPPSRSVEYTVTQNGRGFDVDEDGKLLTHAPYPIDVLMLLDRRVYLPALAPYAGTAAALLGAACAQIGETRLLLVGDRDVAGTALLLKLLTGGAVVEGDWYTLLADDVVTTVARSLRVSQDVVAAAPEAARLVDGQPFVQDALGRVVWSFDPTTRGLTWEIGRGAVDAIVVVESNPGGRSRLERRPRHEAAQDVVAAIDVIPGEQVRPQIVAARIAAACRLVDACSCWRLRLGDLDEAAALLGRIE